MPKDLEQLATARTDELTLMTTEPFFQLFSVGEEVVRHVGLFDESYYPAHYQDIDYLRRVSHNGFHVKHMDLGVKQDESAVIRANEVARGIITKVDEDNRDYYQMKTRSNDYSAGHWSLTRRRRNEWLR